MENVVNIEEAKAKKHLGQTSRSAGRIAGQWRIYAHGTAQRTDEASRRAGHWQNRCELVAPESIRVLIGEVFRTNPVKGKPHPQRPDVIAALKGAMRADLGISPD